MICSFCGSDNQPEYRFCGMCGVRMERRKMERRTNDGAKIKCSACGHVSGPGYKFCGMCGARSERRVAERRGSGPRANAIANIQLPTPERPLGQVETRPSTGGHRESAAVAAWQPRERASSEPSVIRSSSPSSVTGPSFLGLNSEPQTEGEYLLEDESSSRGGLRALILLVILAAIGGLIFVQWRASYNASPKSPEQPKPEPASVPAPNGKGQLPAKKSQLAITAQKSIRETGKGANLVQGAVIGEPETSKAGKGKLTLAAAKEKKAEPAEEETDTDERATPGKPARELAATRSKPSADLIRAQQYLQGRGVHQSCAHGLRYLKAATDQSDPNAAVQMAALYSSGHCVQQDLVKAYKWYASAHDLQPGNRWIEKNMNQLWAQMTPDERHKASL